MGTIGCGGRSAWLECSVRGAHSRGRCFSRSRVPPGALRRQQEVIANLRPHPKRACREWLGVEEAQLSSLLFPKFPREACQGLRWRPRRPRSGAEHGAHAVSAGLCSVRRRKRPDRDRKSRKSHPAGGRFRRDGSGRRRHPRLRGAECGEQGVDTRRECWACRTQGSGRGWPEGRSRRWGSSRGGLCGGCG